MSYFEQALSAFAVPPASEFGFIASESCSGLCNHGKGPFDSFRHVLDYLLCQGLMHYSSLIDALNGFVDTGCAMLPERPLIVDLGCGPATVLFALQDWFARYQSQPTMLLRPKALPYIGIDASYWMRDFGERFLQAAAFHDPNVQRLYPTVDDITDNDIREIRSRCDSVIFVTSYVLHQYFMQNMELMAQLMERFVPPHFVGPAWLLCQEANSRNVAEQQIETLAERCRPLGYDCTIANWYCFAAPRVRLLEYGGQAILDKQDPGLTDNVICCLQQIR